MYLSNSQPPTASTLLFLPLCVPAVSTEAYPLFHFENHSSFQSLQDRLNSSVGLSQFVDNKIWFGWNADISDLLLRLMPTFIHDYVEQRVIKALEAELDRIDKNYPGHAPFRRQILSGSHTNIQQRKKDDIFEGE
ncbi:hypothetical protein F4859DRAFT_281194 [Xylaria cf. heliscus]|nr:hypothetical protein F4859DRAFT_281194 [Xylaria cf. heliscus]